MGTMVVTMGCLAVGLDSAKGHSTLSDGYFGALGLLGWTLLRVT